MDDILTTDDGLSSEGGTSTDEDGGEGLQEGSDHEYQDISMSSSILPDGEPKRVLVFTTVVLLGMISKAILGNYLRLSYATTLDYLRQLS